MTMADAKTDGKANIIKIVYLYVSCVHVHMYEHMLEKHFDRSYFILLWPAGTTDMPGGVQLVLPAGLQERQGIISSLMSHQSGQHAPACLAESQLPQMHAHHSNLN